MHEEMRVLMEWSSTKGICVVEEESPLEGSVNFAIFSKVFQLDLDTRKIVIGVLLRKEGKSVAFISEKFDNAYKKYCLYEKGSKISYKHYINEGILASQTIFPLYRSESIEIYIKPWKFKLETI